ERRPTTFRPSRDIRAAGMEGSAERGAEPRRSLKSSSTQRVSSPVDGVRQRRRPSGVSSHSYDVLRRHVCCIVGSLERPTGAAHQEGPMRVTETGAVMKARAIAGTYVVILAWDFVPGQTAKRKGLLGFAIQRTEYDAGGAPVEAYWMRSIKRFRDQDKGLAPGTP